MQNFNKEKDKDHAYESEEEEPIGFFAIFLGVFFVSSLIAYFN